MGSGRRYGAGAGLVARGSWYARSVGLLTAAAVTRLGGGELFVLASTLDSLSPRQARWLAALTGRRQRVTVLALDFVHRAAPTRQLPRTRCFWLDAAPGGGGAAAPRLTDEYTQVAAAGPQGHVRTTYYRAGRPAVAKVNRGALTAYEYFAANGTQLCRDELDEYGRLIRTVDLHPTMRRAVTHRYFCADGRCWLSVWIERDGRWGRAQQHTGEAREFASVRQLQADWVMEQLTACPRPQVQAVGRVARQVAELVRSYPAG